MNEKSTFVYETFIHTTPEKLWDALTKPEFNRVYWNGMWQESEWKKGSSWKLMFKDGRVADSGEVVECDKPRRLVLTWRNEYDPETKAEGYSSCTFALEPAGDSVMLTVTHEIGRPDSKIIEGVTYGWPRVLSNLKSYLETGNTLDAAIFSDSCQES